MVRLAYCKEGLRPTGCEGLGEGGEQEIFISCYRLNGCVFPKMLKL